MRQSNLKSRMSPVGIVQQAMLVVATCLMLTACSQAPNLDKAPEDVSESVGEKSDGSRPTAGRPATDTDTYGGAPTGNNGAAAPKKSAAARERVDAEPEVGAAAPRPSPVPGLTDSRDNDGLGTTTTTTGRGSAARERTVRRYEYRPPAAPHVNQPTATPDAPSPSAPTSGADGVDDIAAGAPPEPAAAAPEEATEEEAADTAETADTEEPAKQEPFQVVPVFYGTDRAAESNTERVSYGSERSHVLKLGKADVTVPLIHKAPKIERPWLIEIPYFKLKVYEQKEDPAKHFTIQSIEELTRDKLLAEVKSILGSSKTFKDHAFVFVHGFNTSFDNALYRTAQISYDMKFDGAAFVYSWPSGGNVASYTYDSGSTEQAEPHLKAFLNMVIKESGATSISLIAHSMGNELLLRVLQTLEPEVPDGVQISQIIFAAPDVDRDKFRNLAKGVSEFASGVTLYAAANDRALGYSAKFWGGVPRAGHVPNGVPIIVSGIDSIDVTSVSTDSLGLNHSGYAENKALLDDIKQLLLTGTRPPDKRVPSIPKVTIDSGEYWRFAPAN